MTQCLFFNKEKLTHSLSYFVLITIFSLLILPQTTQAHARWKLDGNTPPRNNSTGIKENPCGVPRTSTPMTFEPGETIEVEWEETINHPGYFTISFSPANDEGFENFVLLDNIPEIREQEFYKATITLPNMICDDCTLQLIQVMLDQPETPYYYSCADIVLKAPVPSDTVPPRSAQNLMITSGRDYTQLSWNNPVEDFYKTMVLQSRSPANFTPTNQLIYNLGDQLGNTEVIYLGSGASINLSLDPLSGTYYYTLYTYDLAGNYSTPINGITTLVEVQNEPPQINFLIEQRGQQTLIVTQNGGNVIVQVNITDPNPNDSHNFNWSQTDPRLIDLDFSENSITFDPLLLAEDSYPIHVRIEDSGIPVMKTEGNLNLQVIKSLINSGENQINPEAEAVPVFPFLGYFGYLNFLYLLFTFVIIDKERARNKFLFIRRTIFCYQGEKMGA